MNPTEKALWFVESHLPDAISLDDVAQSSGVSRFHVTRAFGAATGRSVMGYMRARRLSEAARKLAGGAPDILSVALDAGYGSHEAFTRAFRDLFGTTPELVRAQGSTDTLDLVEPILMDQSFLSNLEPPRFETSRPFLIAGLGERYSCETSAGIPMLWQRFGPYIGNIPGETGDVAYGVCVNGDDAGNFD
ncbi:AraC family transcriptional regulator, partial [Mesorhizobium sp. M4B.F.Ca.ET.089.01.1.1]